MPEYYFDIETVPLEQYRADDRASFEPLKAKVISIQYQQLDSRTGQALTELTVLKEWEAGSSEKSIIMKFKSVFVDGSYWNFVPVGNNLVFENRFMKHKLKEYCNAEGLKLGQRPMIELKHLLVIANNGSFKGYDRLVGKSNLAANMTQWYYDKNWPMIEQYVRQEASDFIRVYSRLKTELPKISAW